MHDQQGSQTEMACLADEREYFFSGLLNRKSVKVEPGINLIMAKTKLSLHSVVNTRALKLQYVPSVKRSDPRVSQRVYDCLLALCSPLSTLALILRQSLLDQTHTRVTPERGDAGHFLSKKIFVTHG